MRNLTKLALIAVISAGAMAANSYAASAGPIPSVNGPLIYPGGTPPGGGGGPNCVVLCTPNPSISQLDYQTCSDKLGQLKVVTRDEVAAIGPERRVHLSPLCADPVGRTLTETETRYLDRGNIQGLLTVIAENPVLADTLAQGGYKANDVLGILVGSNAAVLYVHKQ